MWNIALPVAEDTTSSIFKAYGVGPLPDTVVMDRSGKVVYARVGVSDFDDLRRTIEGALARPA